MDLVKVMLSTSISLALSNQKIDPERISGVLGIQPSLNDHHSDQQADRKAFPFWEIAVDDAQGVEQLLALWVALLEKVHSQLKALSEEDLGAYLDVRVYETNFYLEDNLLSRLGATGIGISVWFSPPAQTAWKEPEHASTLTFPGPSFCCQLDEDHFFRWLQQIEGVKEVRGHLRSLTVYLSVSSLSDAALRNFLGLLYRYAVPMSVLRSQL